MLLIVPPNTENDNDVSNLIQVATCLGWSIHRAASCWQVPKELIGQEGAVYGHGSGYFCKIIADQMNWNLLHNPIDWLTTIPYDYMRRTIRLSTFGEAKLLKERAFIKPAEEDKLFPASVYEDGSKLPSSLKSFDDAPVLISGTIPYASEWRCFVKDNEVVSITCYRYYGEIPQTMYNYDCNLALEWMHKMLDSGNVKSVPASIDIGKSRKGFYSVIETSPAYTSRLYRCELVGTLAAIKASCVMKDIGQR